MQILKTRSELWILVSIIILGAFLRLYQADSLPPAASYDPAYYGVDALKILDGDLPIYLPSNFGREVLFSYVVAAAYAILGAGALGIHMASALIGVLTIPVTYLATRVLFADEPRNGRMTLSLTSSLVMALSYWHLNWSRFGVRAIMVPLFAAAVTATLWRGLQTKRSTCFASTGFLLGLGLYTYQAARFLPILIFLWLIGNLILRRSNSKYGVTSKNIFLVLGVMAVVSTPLVHYAITHPGQLVDRVNQIFVVEEENTLVENGTAVYNQTIIALKMFSIVGHDDPLVGIPKRPSLNPFLSIAFYLGILISLWRIKRPQYLFLLLWLAILFIPAMVAGHGAAAKRAIGVLPAVTTLIAIGLVVPWQLAKGNRLAYMFKIVWGTTLVIGMMYTAVITYQDYFIKWGQDPNLAQHFQLDHSLVGKYIGTLPKSEQVYLSAFDPQHPSIQFNSHNHPNIRGYNGSHCQIYPAPSPQKTNYVIVPGKTESSLPRLKKSYPHGNITASLHRPGSQQNYYDVYYVPGNATPQISPQHSKNISWENNIELFGFDINKDSFHPGDEIVLTIYYRAIKNIRINYTAFVHLMDNRSGDHFLWGQSDNEPCKGFLPTSAWTKGEVISDTIKIQIPNDTPSGVYQLMTGFYTWPDLQRSPIHTGTQLSSDQTAILQTIQVSIN